MKTFLKCYGWHMLLFLNVYLISLFAIEIFRMYDKADQTGMQSVDTLSSVSVQFVVEADGVLDFSFLEEEKSDYALMRRISNDIPVYSVICTDGYFRVKEGRTFNSEDFEENQAVMICGSQAEEIVDVDPFIYRGREYHKVGTVESDGSLAAQYGVFVAGGNRSEEYQGAELILEGRSGNGVEKVFSRIKAWAEQQGYEVKELDKKESRINDVYNVSDKGLKIVLLSILALCSSIVMIIYFWLGQYDETRKVYFLMGMRNVEAQIGADYVRLFIAAYICAMITLRSTMWRINASVFLALSIVMTAVLAGCLVLRRRGADTDEKGLDGSFI